VALVTYKIPGICSQASKEPLGETADREGISREMGGLNKREIKFEK